MPHNKKRGFLTKVRYPTFHPWSGNLVIRTCEKCRIKDGLSTSYITYGICSFCGRKERVYMGTLQNYHPTVARTNRERWRWSRESRLT